jgi:glutaredoxin
MPIKPRARIPTGQKSGSTKRGTYPPIALAAYVPFLTLQCSPDVWSHMAGITEMLLRDFRLEFYRDGCIRTDVEASIDEAASEFRAEFSRKHSQIFARQGCPACQKGPTALFSIRRNMKAYILRDREVTDETKKARKAKHRGQWIRGHWERRAQMDQTQVYCRARRLRWRCAGSGSAA